MVPQTAMLPSPKQIDCSQNQKVFVSGERSKRSVWSNLVSMVFVE